MTFVRNKILFTTLIGILSSITICHAKETPSVFFNPSNVFYSQDLDDKKNKTKPERKEKDLNNITVRKTGPVIFKTKFKFIIRKPVDLSLKKKTYKKRRKTYTLSDFNSFHN